MSIQIIPQPTAASSIGSSLGEAVSNYLPKEIDRYRLRKGLENIGKVEEGQPQKTPYQILSSLASVPGIDPGLISVLGPALQQQLARQEALSGGGGRLPFPQETGVSAPGASQAEEGRNYPSERREYREGYLQQPSGKSVADLTQHLLRTQPYNYPDQQSAQAQAEKVLGQDYQADIAYQQRLDSLESEFNKALTSYLQKGGAELEGEIGGRTKEALRNAALEEMTSSNTAPRKIAEKYAKKAFDIAMEKKSMRQIESNWSLLRPPGQKEIDSLRSINEKYKKHGIPQDVFIDDLVSTNDISKGAASYIADPLYETSAGKYLHSLKPNRGFEGIKRTFTSQESKVAKELSEKISPKDLMGSIAYIAQEKGLDPQKLLGEIQRIMPPDKITEQQARDLRERMIPPRRTLNEVWLMGFSGEKGRAAR